MVRAHFALDLARPRARPGAVVLGLLVSGLILLAVAGWRTAHRVGVLEQVQGQLEVARTPAPSTRTPHGAPAAQRSQALRSEAATLRGVPDPRRLDQELARVASELHRPWLPLLAALEQQAMPRVRLQQISVDAGFSRLQLQVEARDLAAVLHYVKSFDAAAAPLGAARLLSHEWVAPAGAGSEGSAVGEGNPSSGAAAQTDRRHLVARISVPLTGTAPARPAHDASSEPAPALPPAGARRAVLAHEGGS